MQTPKDPDVPGGRAACPSCRGSAGRMLAQSESHTMRDKGIESV